MDRPTSTTLIGFACALATFWPAPGALWSQAAPPAADTTRGRDTTQLEEVEVTVTRSSEQGNRVPMAVSLLRSDAIRRANPTIGLDESLSRLPGVVVLNRSNFSLDQRVSLRGAGARGNFGVRGVKVLLDGIPQTLPDGQSQLTNLDLGLISRVEVLTGSAGALYGNASGGVLAFTTETANAPASGRIRVTGGSFGTSKWQGVAGGMRGMASGLVSLSRFRTDGFRQHGGAEATTLSTKLDVILNGNSSLGVRFAATDAPKAENPGALTVAEYAATRDSAASANILRDADKDLSQQQLSLRYRWFDGSGAELDLTAFGLHRHLDNPLATAPPAPVTPTSGTFSSIGRVVGGIRASGTVPLGGLGSRVRLAGGVDLQTMRDNRSNERSDGGTPTGVLLADQRETVTELGPFAQVHWEVAPSLLVLSAVRYDRLEFRVTDHLLTDGVDNSGKRVMESVSGSIGTSLAIEPSTTVYASLATSFESPTTTELVNQSNGSVGFNTTLGPQRTVSAELGVRGRLGSAVDFTLAAFGSRVRDAIVQAREQDGRAFFQNAGRVRNHGAEVGIGASPASWLRLQGAYTYAKYVFNEYRIPNGAVIDTLDGKRLAGVPRHFFRASAQGTFGAVRIEVEQSGASDVFGDDRNTIHVDGWEAGITTLRLSGSLERGALRFEPFVVGNNVFDRRYVGSVNLNGAFGRVLEPAPGRTVYLGVEVGWKRQQ